MKYYLAYGPNLNLVQMRQRCPNARVVGYTYLFGARLVFRGSKNGCFLTTDFQQPWCPSMVGCGVYEISDKDEQALDVYAGFLISTRSRQCRYSVSGTSLRDGKFCIILKQSFTPCPPATPWVFLPAAICRSARAGMMTFISASFRCAKL